MHRQDGVGRIILLVQQDQELVVIQRPAQRLRAPLELPLSSASSSSRSISSRTSKSSSSETTLSHSARRPLIPESSFRTSWFPSRDQKSGAEVARSSSFARPLSVGRSKAVLQLPLQGPQFLQYRHIRDNHVHSSNYFPKPGRTSAHSRI